MNLVPVTMPIKRHESSTSDHANQSQKSKHRYQIKCARHVSGVTFIMYPQSQDGKPNNLKVFGSKKTKGSTPVNRIAKGSTPVNRIAKIIYGHLIKGFLSLEV